MDKEKIEQLKNKYPEGIYEGKISFSDVEGKFHEVDFIYRVPVMSDMESFSKSAQKSVMVANLNLLQSLIVHPDPASIVNSIQDFPLAYAKFVEDAVIPFFGANPTFRGRKL